MGKVWFITGASGGFGRKCTELALAAGDKVAATARRTYVLDDLKEAYGDALLVLKLDVTDAKAVKAAVEKTLAVLERIDVLLNAVGASYYAPVEELDPDKLAALFSTNYWGPFNVIQAVLPVMRAQKGGRIIQITSIDGVVTWPLVGGYCSSKWALEGLLETLALETAEFNIKVSMVEPGPFATDLHKKAQYELKPIPAYNRSLQAHLTQMQNAPFKDPAILAAGIMKLAQMANPPLRAVSDRDMFGLFEQAYAKRLGEWAVLEEL